ncbi:MAG: hypothetical protein RMJ51_02555 [Candidatus Calescibacterium sp.]|nr:hypothetical protein [Candidatus Calescibacterium sp.]MCX7972288.1 hypothetical protein [bacterium]MDW8195108.1 hypothetical protein [Candidatus Calescibacterium sp.]
MPTITLAIPLYAYILLKTSFALSISPNNEYACILHDFNKYYLFSLKNKKLVVKHELQDYYDNVFFISSSKIALVKKNRLYILDSASLKKELELGFNRDIREIRVLKEEQNRTLFLVLTDYSIRYFMYEKNTINLLAEKNLIKFFDIVLKDGKAYVGNNVFLSIFNLNQFLGFRWINQKNLKFDEPVYSLDIGENKIVILHYISNQKRKVGIYSIDGRLAKNIDLEGNYLKLWLTHDEKEIMLFDKTNSTKILNYNGSIRETNIYGSKILDMQKYSEGFVLILQGYNEDPEFVILTKDR